MIVYIEVVNQENNAMPYDPPDVSQTYRSTDISADLILPTFGDLIAKK